MRIFFFLIFFSWLFLPPAICLQTQNTQSIGKFAALVLTWSPPHHGFPSEDTVVSRPHTTHSVSRLLKPRPPPHIYLCAWVNLRYVKKHLTQIPYTSGLTHLAAPKSPVPHCGLSNQAWSLVPQRLFSTCTLDRYSLFAWKL